MLCIGDRVRDLQYGVTGKVISLHNIQGQGALAVIRLDKDDPLLGSLTTDFERELEILGPKVDSGIASERDPLRSRALATRTGTVGKEGE